jgi:glycosyltransferase involved in cell wall biosynthesis
MVSPDSIAKPGDSPRDRDRMHRMDLSVVIPTYNRCDELAGALRALLAQDAGTTRYELIVADNNSTDRTRQLVASLIEGGESRLRYVFEGHQGAASARNAGIAVAVAPIIAFTDDDIRVAPSWIAEIKRALDEHPEVDAVGGKILPQWPHTPPGWLTREHWVGPLALQDYGSAPFYVNAGRPLSLASANMAYRQSVFGRLGAFAPAFSNTDGDHSDTEMLLRLCRHGLQALYVPSIVVTAHVQPERLLKAYHRRWFFKAGRNQALMRFDEIFDPAGRLDAERVAKDTLFGTPASTYRALLTASAAWLGATLRRHDSIAFMHENRLRYLVGYIGKNYERFRREPPRGRAADIWLFTASILKRKIRSVLDRALGRVA